MLIAGRCPLWLAIIVAGYVSAVSSGAGRAATRTWTDVSGEHKVEAELLGFQDGKVRLRRVVDGIEIEVAVSRLSDGDRKYLADLARQTTPDASPAASAESASATSPHLMAAAKNHVVPHDKETQDMVDALSVVVLMLISGFLLLTLLKSEFTKRELLLRPVAWALCIGVVGALFVRCLLPDDLVFFGAFESNRDDLVRLSAGAIDSLARAVDGRADRGDVAYLAHPLVVGVASAALGAVLGMVSVLAGSYWGHTARQRLLLTAPAPRLAFLIIGVLLGGTLWIVTAVASPNAVRMAVPVAIMLAWACPMFVSRKLRIRRFRKTTRAWFETRFATVPVWLSPFPLPEGTVVEVSETVLGQSRDVKPWASRLVHGSIRVVEYTGCFVLVSAFIVLTTPIVAGTMVLIGVVSLIGLILESPEWMTEWWNSLRHQRTIGPVCEYTVYLRSDSRPDVVFFRSRSKEAATSRAMLVAEWAKLPTVGKLASTPAPSPCAGKEECEESTG